MKFEVNKLKCAGCGACLRACPHGAIKIGEDGKAFIDQGKCKKCGKCQGICPFDSIEEILEEVARGQVSIPYGPLANRRRDLGMGRGFGRGPRDGRGGGRGGGGRRNQI
jgi:NAD-dependent dihydropyrimidine dehydrogenase PreA subunit